MPAGAICHELAQDLQTTRRRQNPTDSIIFCDKAYTVSHVFEDFFEPIHDVQIALFVEFDQIASPEPAFAVQSFGSRCRIPVVVL